MCPIFQFDFLFTLHHTSTETHAHCSNVAKGWWWSSTASATTRSEIRLSDLRVGVLRLAVLPRRRWRREKIEWDSKPRDGVFFCRRRLWVVAWWGRVGGDHRGGDGRRLPATVGNAPGWRVRGVRVWRIDWRVWNGTEFEFDDDDGHERRRRRRRTQNEYELGQKRFDGRFEEQTRSEHDTLGAISQKSRVNRGRSRREVRGLLAVWETTGDWIGDGRGENSAVAEFRGGHGVGRARERPEYRRPRPQPQRQQPRPRRCNRQHTGRAIR